MFLPEEPARSATRKATIIVFSHLRWDFVFQRPQQILTRAVQDFHIIYMEEPVFEGSDETFREFERGAGVRVIQPILPVGSSKAAVISHQRAITTTFASRGSNGPIYLWYYTPMAMEFGHGVSADAVIFDKMDELSAFAFAPPELRAFETALMQTADVVFTGGASLHAAAIGRNANLHCFPSSIDARHFGKARCSNDADPADQSMFPRPRLGFFGVIDERIDLQLIADVAALRPHWQLVMVGPTAKIDPQSLPQAPNIHWLGARAYEQLPTYMAHWDIGFMPFALNDSTRFISPTKTPEFLAAGLPVISTPIRDVVEPYGRLGLVDIIGDAQAFVEAGDRILVSAGHADLTEARLARADLHLSTGSWDATWAAMQACIEAATVDVPNRDSFASAKESAHV